MAARVPARLTAGELRRFGVTVGAVFAALALVSWWRGHTAAPLVLGAAGLLLFGFGLIAPARLGAVERNWMRMAAVISRVTTPLLLAAVYFGVITPTALVMRLVGRDPLRLRRGAGGWIERASDARRRADMERLF